MRTKSAARNILLVNMTIDPTLPQYESLEADIIVEQEDCNLVIISDLHLGEGYLQTRRAYARCERFFSDEAFHNFLEKIHTENIELAKSTPPKPLKLIINGDFIDFFRTTTSAGSFAAIFNGWV